MACSQQIPASLKLAPFFLLLLIVQCSIPTANAIYYQILWDECSRTANYSSNSTYQSNLNRLLSTLSASTPPTGYANLTVGQAPDQVYGLAQCRGDESSSVCQTCIDTATSDIVRNCSRSRSGTLWYEECFLRYSNESFFSPTSTAPLFYLCNPNNVSDVQLFNTLLGNLMDDLSKKAAYSSLKMYATGIVNYTSFQNIYAMVQCTRDLSPDTCYKCIQEFRNKIPNYCGIKQGGRTFGDNCYIRYEMGYFYNISAGDGTTSPPPSPAPSTTNATDTPQKGTSDGGKSNIKTVLAIAIPVAATLILFVLAIFLCLHRKKRRNYGVIARGENRDMESTEFSMFNLDMLKTATNNFSEANMLGEGGFGPVYKGKLRDGGLIAVKRLSRSSGQGVVELKNEVALVVNLQHRNLVRLLGFCLEEEEKLLVYEYLPNKSLDKVIFDPTRRTELDWAKRHKIIEGIARGLLYLHEDSRLKIIHRDMKASNILLDQDMTPKISDFGLAKLFDMDETQRNTNRIAGTYGYMAPEYAMHGLFSIKSDVFSYGVLILEIVSGRRNGEYDGHSGTSTNLLSYVWRSWNQGRALEIVDQTLLDQYQSHEVIKCIHIGLLCVQEDPAERPNMTTVVLMLSSNSVGLPSPSPPAFVFQDSQMEHSVLSDVSSNNNTKKNSREISNNDITTSEVQGR